MKKYNAFNFVELLLVMLVLGIIISLTMPLIKNIKDDDDIYRSYMKKSNQEVIDAFTMGLIQNRARDIVSANVNNCTALRNFFNTSIKGISCNDAAPAQGQPAEAVTCANNRATASGFDGNAHPFIVLGGKSVMAFHYNVDNANPVRYGYVYVDMNGSKSPNQICKDRYRFVVYRDRVAMDTDTRNNNQYACSFNL